MVVPTTPSSPAWQPPPGPSSAGRPRQRHRDSAVAFGHDRRRRCAPVGRRLGGHRRGHAARRAARRRCLPRRGQVRGRRRRARRGRRADEHGDAGRAARAQGGRGEPRRGSPASLVGARSGRCWRRRTCPRRSGSRRWRSSPGSPTPRAACTAFLPTTSHSTRWGRGTRSRTSSACARRSPTWHRPGHGEPGGGGVRAGPRGPRRPAGAAARGPRARPRLAGPRGRRGRARHTRPAWRSIARPGRDCGPLPPMEVRRSGSGRARATPPGGPTSSAWCVGAAAPDAPTTSRHVGAGDERRRPGPAAVADGAGRAAGGRGRRRVARADPDEEGPPAPTRCACSPPTRSGPRSATRSSR